MSTNILEMWNPPLALARSDAGSGSVQTKNTSSCELSEGVHSQMSALKLSEFEVRHCDGSKLSFGKSNMNNVEATAFHESDHDLAWI